jgi:hypothetical protein
MDIMFDIFNKKDIARIIKILSNELKYIKA